MIALLFALSLAGDGQAPPPPPPPMIQAPRDPGRRPPPEAVGTGAIRGRVVAADTGSPVRRANVNLTMVQPPMTAGGAPPLNQNTVLNVTLPGVLRPRTATTDAQGGFTFTGLPPGSYRVTASPGQFSAGYLPMTFGAKKPSGPGSTDLGTPIELADGQTFDKAVVGLVRGAVITGRVTDENGEPLSRVQVNSVLFPGGAARGIRTSTASTDDLGQFRIFGLVPGEYGVAAEARGNTFVPPNAPPEAEEDRVGFVTTYYPGTADEAAGQRVRTRTGAETAGVEIRMVSGRLFYVSGMVVDSQGRSVARAGGTFFKRSQGTIVASSFGFSTDDQGRFQMRNVAPGTYRLTVRQQMPPGVRAPDGWDGEVAEFASMPITIASDLEGILITTSPGAAISGTVVFDGGPPQLAAGQTFQMRVSAQAAEPENSMGLQTPPPALVTPDLTFTMRGLAGDIILRSSAPNQYLKAVLLGAQDITDAPHEFKNGERVTIVMTSRASALEGTVTDAAGKPVTSNTLIMLFSDDKTLWRSNALRTRRTGPDSTGHFRIPGLLPGRYYLVAMPSDRMTALGPPSDPSVFEALSKEAVTLVVGEDEQRQVDLKLAGGGGN